MCMRKEECGKLGNAELTVNQRSFLSVAKMVREKPLCSLFSNGTCI